MAVNDLQYVIPSDHVLIGSDRTQASARFGSSESSWLSNYQRGDFLPTDIVPTLPDIPF